MKSLDRGTDVSRVYEQYHSQIKRFLQSNLRSHEDAEEFKKLYEEMRKVRDGG